MNHKTPCPTNQLTELLEDSLDPTSARTVEAHLETCQACRSALEQASGENQFWSDVAALSDDELDRDWSRFNLQTAGGNSLDGTPARRREQKLQAVYATIKHLLSPTDDPRSVGRIGNYEILGLIGSGGMGVVLKARDPSLDRIVALKILAPHLATFDSAKERFRREAKAAAAVQHDGIIPIYGVDSHCETPYFVMPYEAGPSLQQRIETDGALTVQEALRVAKQIAAALSAAHETGLVHRDIKPSNILLAPGTERALLTDFGLAQVAADQTLTATGLLAGTPTFMSPEQARGEDVDHRSDLFSLGSVLFTMLVGKPPVTGNTTYAVVRKIGGEPMPRLEDVAATLPHWLDELVARLHEHDPEQRFQSAEELDYVIGDCLAFLADPLKHTLPNTLVKSREQRPPARLLAPTLTLSLAALALVAIVGISVTPWFRNVDREEAPQQPAVPTTQIEIQSDESANLSWNDGLERSLEDLRLRLERIETSEDWVFQSDEALLNDEEIEKE